MDDIEITAGQLHIINTTFLIDFKHQDTLEIIGSPHISFNMWMSFDAIPDFKIANVFIGDPVSDYNITVEELEVGQLGELRTPKLIMDDFKLYSNYILTDGKEFDIYKMLFAAHPVLKNLKPTFADSRMYLIDRYISMFFNPQFETMLNFLRNVFCVEDYIRNNSGWFWKIVCVDMPKSEDLKIETNEHIQGFLKDVLEIYENKAQ